jgi:hypothetical protein
MTAGAVRKESRVIHTSSGERCGALVATLAGRTGDNMSCGPAGRGAAVAWLVFTLADGVPTDDGVGVTDLLEFDAGVFVWGAGLFAAAAAVAAATAGGLVAVDGGTFGAGTLLGTVAPAKLTVLKWQFPQGAEVTM